MFLRKFALLSYIVGLHLLLAVALIKSNLLDLAEVKLGFREAGFSWPQRLHRDMDPQVPTGATVFFGDSITQSLVATAVAPNAVNFGVSGARSDHLLHAIASYQSLARAKHVVITIGTNDVLHGRTEGIEDRYRAILAKVPAHLPVTLSGIPPMAKKDVRHAVEAARAACSKDSRCRFSNAFAALTKTPGALDADGIHLSQAGYQAWADLLRADIELTPAASHP